MIRIFSSSFINSIKTRFPPKVYYIRNFDLGEPESDHYFMEKRQRLAICMNSDDKPEPGQFKLEYGNDGEILLFSMSSGNYLCCDGENGFSQYFIFNSKDKRRGAVFELFTLTTDGVVTLRALGSYPILETAACVIGVSCGEETKFKFESAQ